MQISSQRRLEILFKKTPYTDTFIYIQDFKPKQIRFQDIFNYLDYILYSHTWCEWVFYIGDWNNKHIALFYLPILPPQATPQISDFLYTDIIYTINLDASPACYCTKYIKKLLKLDEQNQQLAKQQLTKWTCISLYYLFVR